jgi:hypothetical protein
MNSGTSHTSSLKNFIKGIPFFGPTAAKLSQLPVFADARRIACSARFMCAPKGQFLYDGSKRTFNPNYVPTQQ